MRHYLDFPGEVRFDRTNDPSERDLKGIVGWHPTEGEPVPIRAIYMADASDGRSGDYAVPAVRQQFVGEAMRLAAKGHPAFGRMIDQLVAEMRSDPRKDKERGLAGMGVGLPEDDLRGEVARSLRISVDPDAFRTTKHLASALGIQGDMGLLRSLEPLCASLLQAAADPEICERVARNISELSRPGNRVSQDVVLWRERLTSGAVPAP